MLYHLEKLRSIQWDKLWANVAKRTAIVYGSTRLGDQDIMNAVIKQNPNIVYEVPCQWNTQLSDHTLSHKCYQNNPIKVILQRTEQIKRICNTLWCFFKVVHWNSPKKINVINQDGDYFRSLYQMFLEFNGNLLRRQLYDCTNSSKNFSVR